MWRFLTKLALELPYDPAIPLLGIYSQAFLLGRGSIVPSRSQRGPRDEVCDVIAFSIIHRSYAAVTKVLEQFHHP